MDDLPPDVEWRVELTADDRTDLCPAFHTVLLVHCARSADPVTRLHDGPHAGLGFPRSEDQ